MASEDLQLLGPHDAWHGAAHRGRLHLPDGRVEEVRVLLGPETTSSDAIERARRAASFALALRHEAVMSLRAVVPFAERIAWVYEATDGVGLGHTLAHGEDAMLSARAAAEVIARAAEVLVEVGPEGWDHPGPEASDLILDAAGALHVAGFASPFPRTPAMRAPQGEEGEQALVYRLGVLLAQLVSGAVPSTASDRGSHAAVVRRVLIRTMSRPGPVMPERYGDWLRGLLAWEPSERPPLSSVSSGLRIVAQSTAGPSLFEWAALNVASLEERVQLAARRRRWNSEGSVLGRDAAPEATAEEDPDTNLIARRVAVPPSPHPLEERSGGPLPLRDDDTMADEPTQEHGVVEPELVDSKPPIRVTSLLPMPVQVGPPPEAVRTRPSLPPGFLDGVVDSDEPVSRLERAWLTPRSLWTAGGLLGLIAVLLLVVNLVLWGRAPVGTAPAAPHPSIADVLDGEDGAGSAASGRRFTVTVQGPSGAPLTLRCGDASASGVGSVALEGVAVGPCTVRGVVAGDEHAVEVDVVGPTTLVCFRDAAIRCR